MANEERRYGTLLQQRYFERFGTRPCSVTEEDIRDFIEVSRLESGEIFSVSQLKASRSPRELALEVALSCEQSAQHYYSRLNQITEDAELRALYRELADFETNHADFLQKKMDDARRTSSDSKLQ